MHIELKILYFNWYFNWTLGWLGVAISLALSVGGIWCIWIRMFAFAWTCN